MKRLADNEIDENFKKVDELFDKISKRNAEELGYAQLKPIDEKFPFAQNGITAMIAPVGLRRVKSLLSKIVIYSNI